VIIPVIALVFLAAAVAGYTAWGFIGEYWRMLNDIDDRNAADGF